MKKKNGYSPTYSDSEISQKFSEILSTKLYNVSDAISIIRKISYKKKLQKFEPRSITIITDNGSKDVGYCYECVDLNGVKYTTIELIKPNGNNIGTLLHEFAHSIVYIKYEFISYEHDANFYKQMDTLIQEYDLLFNCI